jgi:hypothetical protein
LLRQQVCACIACGHHGVWQYGIGLFVEVLEYLRKQHGESVEN